MGKITEFTAEEPVRDREIITYQYEVVTWREALSESRARIIRAWKGTQTTEDQASGVLDAYYRRHDPISDSANGPILGKPQTIKKLMVVRGRMPNTILLVFLVCWIVAVYMGTLYLLGFVQDGTTGLIERVKLVPGSLAASFDDFRNPGSPQEVAHLMGEFYELLSKMGYFEPEVISRPPHNPAINRTKAVEIGLTPRAIEMIEMLPYVGPITGKESDEIFTWSNYDEGNFMLYGRFVDYREQDFLEEPRDPLYAVEYVVDAEGKATDKVKDFDEDGGRYIKPSYVELMTTGNHGAFMVLNTDNYRIWTVDSESGNIDPTTQNMEIPERPNRLDMNNYPSRPAKQVLPDFMQKFMSLDWMPGGLSKDSYEGDAYASLYLSHGWPASFDRSAFLQARVEWEAAEEARQKLEEPFQELPSLEQRLDSLLKGIERKHKQIAEIDAGGEMLPVEYTDPMQWRDALNEEVGRLVSEILPQTQADLELVRDRVRELDPMIGQARKERIAKYGY